MRERKLFSILRQNHILWQTDKTQLYHPLLTSGLHSDLYINCCKLLESPNLTSMFLREFVTDSILSKLKDISVFIGVQSGGIPISYMLPMVFPQLSTSKFIFVVKSGFNDHSYWNPDELLSPIIIVDDLITTGSTIRTILSSASISDKISAIFCLFNRSGLNFLEVDNREIPIIACVNIDAQKWEESECLLCKSGSIPIRPKLKWNLVE